MGSLYKIYTVVSCKLSSALCILTVLAYVSVTEGSSDGRWFQDLCSYKWEAIDQDSQMKYTMKLCDNSPDTQCGEGSAVCAHSIASKMDTTVGELGLSTISPTVLDFNSTQKCEGGSGNMKTSISFLCGKTMGTPELVTVSECVHYFEWRTYVACKIDKFKPHKEVPCYAFDSDGKKHDLNPLIKITDGYLVDDSDDDIDFYINICRSLNRPQACPEDSAACLTTKGASYNMGIPSKQLELLSNDRLKLRYEDSHIIPEFCDGHKPAVTITFICPSGRQEGSVPKMTAKTNCRYEIEWVTEYACHRDYLESHSCKLTNEQHDISIDLTHLTLGHADDPYHTKSSEGRDGYIYYLNVCGEISAGICKDEKGFISACQVKENADMKKVAGRYKNQTLRYSDGDLTLTYPGGNRCTSGFQRMTIINFECNETAENDGKGFPVFTGETDCTYYFEWYTAYACVKEKEDLLCRVTSGKKRYDLSPLTRFPESETLQNWEAVDASAAGSDRKRIYLNMCHKVLQQGALTGCPDEAAVCAIGKDGKPKSLGSFLSAPQMDGNSIRLIYTEGDVCRKNIKTRTIISLKCKPGDLESAPVVRSVSSDECIYELEWHTAAACVLSKTEGEGCKVSDPQAGFSFDLTPLRKANKEQYSVTGEKYNYLINVCEEVTHEKCPSKSGACQLEKSAKSGWSLGEFNSKLSYYDGMIQLVYKNGSTYNNPQHTRRSTLVSFLCDRQAGMGKPEFQAEDEFTYNFRWYTSLACPERPGECLVTDPITLQQYDLSSLSKSGPNWEGMDLLNRRKYYINVCRPLRGVPGCDRAASVCEMTYETGTEKVSISNMGVAKKGPTILQTGHLLLEYTDGSVCESDGLKTTYTTRIRLVCAWGALSSGPRFLSNKNCTADFIWHTKAACAIESAKDSNQTCTITDPNTDFVFDLHPLATKTGYKAEGIGRTFLLNICGAAPDCGTEEGAEAAGCELDEGKPMGQVGVEKTLEFSTEGQLKLTYKGDMDESTGIRNAFTISFVCDADSAGSLKLVKAEMGTGAHHVFFEFATPLACAPATVDCQVIDSHGNEYDLSDLSQDNTPYKPIDTSDQAKSQKFFLSVCKPLPRVEGCPGGALGACAIINGRGLNLGYVQSSPQPASDGSVSIVYRGGDPCGTKGRHSTRIIFICDDSLGSPIFEHKTGCEYVFIWRTSEACPVQRVQGENCKVQDPRSSHVFDLSSLSGQDYEVKIDKYEYHFAVCGGLKTGVCKHKEAGGAVASCQVEGSSHRIAGLATQNLTYEDGLIMINYTQGEKCHKIYERSTAILFTCDHSEAVGKPEYMKETPDCIYMFEWHTALACPPFKTITCTYSDGNGNFYDLSSLSRSSLAMSSSNWRVVAHSGSNATRSYYLNVCKSLVPQSGSWACPSSAAACLRTADDQYVSLGEAKTELQWDKTMLVLRYTDGQLCPNSVRKRTTIIRFKCDKTKEDSEPTLTAAQEDCSYTFWWPTAAACPLSASHHGDCRVTNPATGHVFDLNSLNQDGGYIVYDNEDPKKMIRLNMCSEMKNAGCTEGAAVCIKDNKSAVNGGMVSKKLSYLDQVVLLTYEGGDVCAANRELKHKSVVSFVCKDGVDAGKPVLVGTDKDTCVHYFSWHTSLVCEKQVRCSVWTGMDLIDLRPLIHTTGSYLATDEDVDKENSPDFYINICQPLNPIPGVLCPPGAAVCMDPDKGQPIDIGRITFQSTPEYNSNTGNVEMVFQSTTPCSQNASLNYTSKVIFSCQSGTDLGTPQMIRQQQCLYVFEWATPVVCPEILTTSGCSLHVSQLQYTFNLTSLSGLVQVPASSYKINVCDSIPDSACNNSAVCQMDGASGVSFGHSKAMSLDYKRQDQTVIMTYAGGDPCPPVTDKGDMCVFPSQYLKKTLTECTTEGMTEQRLWCPITSDWNKDHQWGNCATAESTKRQSTILFTCNRTAGRGSPELLSETKGCSSTFRWNTSTVCTPKKMECQLVSLHKTYDLRTLSSLTEPWKFSSGTDQYYINLCQSVHGGLTDCPEGATVCRKNKGQTQTLGLVHTQTLEYREGKILVNYTMGDAVCGSDLRAKTIIQLTCSTITGHPKLQREDPVACEFWLEWETRAACAVEQQEVEMVNGTITLPDTGARINLGDLYTRLHQATGDIRSNGDRYVYDIQLSGITNSSVTNCMGAYICQVKVNGNWHRKIGSSSKAKYYIKGGNLDVLVPSVSTCGRDRKHTVSSAILFHCNPEAGEGIPEFLLETDLCQYLFVWHTSRMCDFFSKDKVIDGTGTDSEADGLSSRSRALGAVLSLLLIGLTVCLLVLLLHKRERRDLVIKKVTGCCKRGNPVAYKYSKVNTEENGEEDEMEWLMEELESPGKVGRHENGHITTKPVSAEAWRALPLDEADSEDEVLTVPGVHIQAAARAKPRARPLPALLRAESDEDLVGLLEERERRRGRPQHRPHRSQPEPTTDDSDEDLLKV
ncbi:cation-independent mannose-6-phosphate receptor-like isoform X1 [Alosa sapidissima]|uniref:cation-independent mannose-6-phosphate receptor-like isoform X1 n=1 Tax=Alosa sapidissima TaxID=34773 RepID=UPI001C08B4FB|nr:cation-independent mannose-6-phosphate receptor-like isoform X1 [Alosa sapidissima]